VYKTSLAMHNASGCRAFIDYVLTTEMHFFTIKAMGAQGQPKLTQRLGH
jgi:hypothetical protein